MLSCKKHYLTCSVQYKKFYSRTHEKIKDSCKVCNDQNCIKFMVNAKSEMCCCKSILRLTLKASKIQVELGKSELTVSTNENASFVTTDQSQVLKLSTHSTPGRTTLKNEILRKRFDRMLAVALVFLAVSCFTLYFLFFSSNAFFPSCNIVVISPCIKAQGTLEPAKGHRSPLGQNTSLLAPCFLIESAEQGKQNLWCPTVGHWNQIIIIIFYSMIKRTDGNEKYIDSFGSLGDIE